MVDDRSPTAKAMSIVSQITSIGLLAVLPVIGGHFLDQWLNTAPWILLAGLILGFVGAGFEFMKLVGKLNEDQTNNEE